MRTLLSTALPFLLAVSAVAQSWMLKAPYEAKSKHVWAVTVTADMGGMQIEAKMKQHLTIESASEKSIAASSQWTDLTVNGEEVHDDQDNSNWKLVLNPNGSLQSAGDDPDIARMLSPAAFIYPQKEVKVGDKWTAKVTPANAQEITATYEVIELTKLGEIEALKISSKFSEADADAGIKSTGHFWVGKDGKVLKFDLDVKNWVVPMAGNQVFDAKIVGELAKS